MNQLFTLVLLCAWLSGQTQHITSRQIATGFTDTLYSNTLKQSRPLWIHLPDAMKEEADTAKRYPVIYAFDGGLMFNSLVGITELLSGSAKCPDAIIIGIIHPDRGRDLTPTHVSNMAPFDPSDTTFSKTSGGGEELTIFLEKELIPYVEAKYRASPTRMLAGHSTGGVMVANTLLKHPALFSMYVSIDPAMWWDNQRLLKESRSILMRGDYKGKSLFTSLSNTLPAGMTPTMAQKNKSINTLHFRSALQFVKNIEASASNGLGFKWRYYPADNHGSVVLITLYDAIRFFFASYSEGK